jgi:hypothetical protein
LISVRGAQNNLTESAGSSLKYFALGDYPKLSTAFDCNLLNVLIKDIFLITDARYPAEKLILID